MFDFDDTDLDLGLDSDLNDDLSLDSDFDFDDDLFSDMDLSEDSFMLSDDEVTILGDPACESQIFMMALESESSPQEYAEIIENAATEMALYGLIDDADAAMEATRRVVMKIAKESDFSRMQKRVCILLAKKAKDPLYKKYEKFRGLWRSIRSSIYKKYGARAKSETRKLMQNSRRKATAMKSNTGKTIVDKIDHQISKMTFNRNGKPKK